MPTRASVCFITEHSTAHVNVLILNTNCEREPSLCLGAHTHTHINVGLCLAPASSTWSQPETQGRQPAARHGHVIVTIGFKLYIHGGMAGERFYNDVHSLDTSKTSPIQLQYYFPCSFAITSECFLGSVKWEKIQSEGDVPPGIAAHSAVSLGKNLYIFGGMTADGVSNSMYRFNTGTPKFLWLPPSLPK